MKIQLRSVARTLAVASAMLAAGTMLTAPPVHAAQTARAARTAGFPTATWPVRVPNAVGMPDPGVIHVDGKWYSLSTGGYAAAGTIKTATQAQGPWKSTGKGLLTKNPGWMAKGAVWAPSIMRAADGTYVVFYAGLVAKHGKAHCIGAATGTSPAGGFTPTAHPIACWKGSGTSPADAVTKEGTGNSFSLIDPTPAQVGGQYVLTYKTEHAVAHAKCPGTSAHLTCWHTTTRMVELDPAKPWTTAAGAHGKSIKITDAVSTNIEENPVLVQHGSTYTLFNSWGLFGRCAYTTRYRQNSSLWAGWLSKKPTNLAFPAHMNTCGDGNAQVLTGLHAGSWRILFNGHIDNCEVSGAARGHGPKGLYVGVVTWSSAGKPSVSRLLAPPTGSTLPPKHKC